MMSFRSRIVAATVTGLALVGAQATWLGDAVGAGGSPGGGTTNGLTPDTFHAAGVKTTVDKFLQQPVTPTTPDPQKLVDDVVTLGKALPTPILLDQAKRLASDTVGCALDGGTSWSGFRGEDLLTPDAGVKKPWEAVSTAWPGSTTDATASRWRREDIFTCLATRLNKFGKEVDIFLSGPHVTPRNPRATKNIKDYVGRYPYREAIWLATLDGAGNLQIDVWPFPEMMDACPGAGNYNLVTLMNLRVCGTTWGGCGVTVHTGPTDLDDACGACPTNEEGVWWCKTAAYDGKLRPAIQTRLNEDAWTVIYGDKNPTGTPVCTPPKAPKPPSACRP